MQIKCPRCRSAIELASASKLADIECPVCQFQFAVAVEDTLTIGNEIAPPAFRQPIPEDEPPESPARRTVGRYHLQRLLGRGATAEVWHAYDPRLDREVVVKFPSQATEREMGAFTREARSIAQLRHPNIIAVHDLGFDEDLPYIVTEHAEGTLLRNLVQQLSPLRAAAICGQVARTLHYIHERGIIHRDIKPGNILITADGEPRLLDFGLALSTELASELEEGTIIGTLVYMSPEQARGDVKKIDQRSDIYSLGLVLYELLTGERPFQGDTAYEILQAIINDAPRPPQQLNPSLPTELEAICLRCLAKDPLQRFDSAEALAEALEDVIAEQEAEVAEAAVGESLRDSSPQHKPTLVQRQRLAELQRSLRTLQGEHQLYLTLVEDLPLGVYRTDTSGKITFANEWFCHALNCQTDRVRNRLLAEVLGVGESSAPARELKQVIETGRVIKSQEVYPNPLGTPTYYEVIKSPVRNLQGQTIGVQGLMFDVSAQEALRTAMEAAEQANQAKSNFLANVSHEIRTPMHAIIGLTDLLLKRELNADQRELLEMILGSGRSLLTIIDDILDLSKIEAQRLQLQLEPFELPGLLKNVLAMFTGQVRDRLSLSLHLQQTVPAWVVGDPVRLRQVLVNLLGNAVKFTEAGSVELQVKLTSNQPADLAQLRFAVRDTGSGIAEHKLTEIFAPFVQADGSISRKHGGTGLGLTISSEFVRLMGGKLEVVSKLGVGSEFYFTIALPVGRAEGNAVPTGLSEPIDQHAALAILVAEDHPINRAFAKQALELAGHSVTLACDGQEALHLLAQHSFDLVLMDVQMPVLDGLQATREIRRREAGTDKHVPVLAMTAHATAGEQESCLQAGMDACLVKPILIDDLHRQVAQVAVRQRSKSAVKPSSALPFDGQRLLVRDGNERAFLADMIALLAEDWPQILQTMQQALQKRDGQELVFEAHKLRGLVNNFFATTASASATKLEQLAKQSQWDAAAEVVRSLPSELEELIAALKRLVSGK